jgi:SAM-dependent methyltransferase
LNTHNRFDGYANDYTIGRPQYADELIDHILEKSNLSGDFTIADIGSGTGKFTSQLLARGCEVYAVEPNDDMRNTAESELSSYKNFHSIKGDAENTRLADHSVDLITTAQAFHWFEVGKFRSECKRIVKENGKISLIWNVRDMSSPLNQELYEIYKKYCPRFIGFNGGIIKDDPRIKEFFVNGYEYISCMNPLTLDKEKFIKRSLSGSYSIKEGDRCYDEYIASIVEVFNRYCKQGYVTIPNSSVAYTGSNFTKENGNGSI